MPTPDQLRDIVQQNAYCNITSWHKAGYKGKGVNILNIDSGAKHEGGIMTHNRILDSAPEANIYTLGMDSYTTKNEVITSLTYKNKVYALEEFIKEFKIKIITRSLGGTNSIDTIESHFYNNLKKKYNLIINQSAGNDGSDGCGGSIPPDVAIYWSACSLNRYGKPVRKNYSSVGEENDFISFTGFYDGTSFVSPYGAGIEALLIQKYGTQLTQEQIYDYFMCHCEDLGDVGFDYSYGNGLPILGNINEEWEWDEVITKTQIMVNGKILEVNRILKNGENYIRLRDFEDVLGVVDVDYDHSRRLPIVND